MEIGSRPPRVWGRSCSKCLAASYALCEARSPQRLPHPDPLRGSGYPLLAAVLLILYKGMLKKVENTLSAQTFIPFDSVQSLSPPLLLLYYL